MLTFIVANLAIAVAQSLILLLSVWRDRSLVVKPSTWLLIILLIFIQWPAVFLAAESWERLPVPWEFFVTSQIIPALILAGNIAFLRSTSRVVWERVKHASTTRVKPIVWQLLLTSGLVVLVLAVYFQHVPLHSTGLATAVATGDYLAARDAREYSYKLLSSPIPRYLYAYCAFFLCRFAGALGGCLVYLGYVRRSGLTMLVGGGVIALYSLIATLSGARYPGAVVIVASIGAMYILRRAPLNPIYPVVGIFAVLIVVGTVELVRTGSLGFGIDRADEISSRVVARAFATPVWTGIWHTDFVQLNGFWGIRGMPRAAVLLGEKPEPIDNIIALVYAGTTHETSIANTSFLFTYYTYFGFNALPFQVCAILLLDCLVLFYRRISSELLVPGMVVLNLSLHSLASSDFTPLLLTFGLIPGCITLVLLSIVFRGRSGQCIKNSASQEGYPRGGMQGVPVQRSAGYHD